MNQTVEAQTWDLVSNGINLMLGTLAEIGATNLVNRERLAGTGKHTNDSICKLFKFI